MSGVFKERIDSYYGYDLYTIKGKKGVSVRKEIRPNHVKGMILVNENGKFPMTEAEYLVLELPITLDAFERATLGKDVGMTYKATKTGCEVAFHTPQVFHMRPLRWLEKKGCIRLFWKQVDHEYYPFYLNPTGWRLAYNLLFGTCYAIKLFLRFLKRKLTLHQVNS